MKAGKSTKKLLIIVFSIVMTSIMLWEAGNPLLSKNMNIRVSVNTAEKKEPISKYIYGQFIEHLGRCIYGGIWAEMLEDRKFFFPVSEDPENPPG